MPIIKYHCEKEAYRSHFDLEADCISHEKECDLTCDICGDTHHSTEMMAKDDEVGTENQKYCDDCFFRCVDDNREYIEED
jgi:hypothetical protein